MIGARCAAAFAVVACVVTAGASQAGACTCVTDASPSSACTALTKADAVFEAVVDTAVAEPVPPRGVIHERTVTFRDVQTLVGAPARVVTTPDQDSACGIDFRPGERYLVVAHRRASDGLLVVSRCSQTRKLPDSGLSDWAKGFSKDARTSRVWGRVLMAGWKPVAGARVSLRGRKSFTATTGEDGRYAVSGLPGGRYRIAAELPAPLAAARLGPPIELQLNSENRCAELDVPVSPDTRITGSIVNPGGTGMLRPIVELWAQPEPGAPLTRYTSHQVDEKGNYTFWDPVPGRYVIGVNVGAAPRLIKPYLEAFASTVDGGREAEVSLGGRAAMSPLTIQLVPVIEIAGRVVRGNGSPASGQTVRLLGFGDTPEVSSARSGTDGTFRLRGFRGERYRFAVVVERTTMVEVEIVAGDQPVTLVLPD